MKDICCCIDDICKYLHNHRKLLQGPGLEMFLIEHQIHFLSTTAFQNVKMFKLLGFKFKS